jgi:Sec7-like guanine-nucleotide exchange factor
MTEEEKAKELTLKLEGEICTSPHSRQAIETAMSEMAKWKEEHLIEVVEDWLKDNVCCYLSTTYDEHSDPVIVYEERKLLDDLKRAIQGK